jgi:arylsulfatase A-like enzyme
MTGRYAFRQKGTGILPGDAALIVPTNQVTLASVLKRAGYTTGIVGKWHLGLGKINEELDWNTEVTPGPREVGFEYSFIMAATGDRVPCVFLENQKVVGLDAHHPLKVSYLHNFPGEPDGVSEYDHLKMKWSHGHHDAVINGIGRIGFMTGGKSAEWKDEGMADTFTRKGIEFIEANHQKPFFLYFATHNIHVPRVPAARFVGQTSMGPRGDSIAEFDAIVGRLLGTLDKLGLTTNTLVILSSDNGPVLDDGYKDSAVELLGNHKPAGPFRGGKYSVFEGGTRMPLIVRWPGHVKPGVTDAMVSQVDFLASFAALVQQPLAAGDAPDSLNMLPALLGESNSGRPYIVEQSAGLGLRQGNWKYIEPHQGPPRNSGVETGNARDPQLYDLETDPGEIKNLAAAHPGIAEKMSHMLAQIRQGGLARPKD